MGPLALFGLIQDDEASARRTCRHRDHVRGCADEEISLPRSGIGGWRSASRSRCDGSIGSHSAPAPGPPARSRTDPGIIDQGGTTGTGNTTGTGTGGTTGTVTPCTAGTPPATTRLFRLTHAQYDNTVRALTGLDVRPSADFPVDQNQAGFDRGIDLQAGDVLGKAYRTAAEALAASVVGNATAFSKVVGCDPAGGNTCRDSFIAGFGRRVFRRPLTDAEKTPLVALFGQGATLIDGTADNFHKGVQIVARGDAAVAELHLPPRAVRRRRAAA